MAFLEIIGSLGQRVSPRRAVPAIPAGRTVSLPAEDEESIAAPPPGSAAPLALFIIYRDSAGRESHRRITCKTFESDKGNLLAWCHERGAFRRFKVARIHEAVIAATGEVIAMQELLGSVTEGESPVGDRALQRLLTVLVFTMKCDGQAHPAERGAIEDAAAIYALRFEKDEVIALKAARRALGLAPDVDDLIVALRWIEGRRDGRRMAQLLLPFVDQVILADGAIASQEAYFGGMIGDALRAIAAGSAAF